MNANQGSGRLVRSIAPSGRDVRSPLFGAYLFVHFAMLVPYGTELFSSRGILPHAPILQRFPDSPACIFALLILGACASLGLVFELHERIAAVTAWLVLALLFIRNPLIGNPSLPFVGWMLLLIAFVRAEDRAMPAWIVTSLAYTYSGWTKLASPSWIDGTAIVHVLTNPLARPTPLRLALLALPAPLLHVMTWSALALELMYAPLALSRRARPLIWTLMLLMHIGLLVLIDFADLSIAMIVVQLFTFDRKWHFIDRVCRDRGNVKRLHIEMTRDVLRIRNDHGSMTAMSSRDHEIAWFRGDGSRRHDAFSCRRGVGSSRRRPRFISS